MSFRTLAFKCFAVLALASLSVSLSAAYEGIVPKDSTVTAVPGENGGFFFNGSFNIDLSEEARDVLERGIPLTFILRVEIEKKRWFWTNKDLGTVRENMRLTYNPLTRQYKVNVGTMTQNFDSLRQALVLMSTISNLLVAPYRDLDDEYVAKARFYLDKSRLPKPFQVTLSKGSGWNLDTGWFNVRINKPK